MIDLLKLEGPQPLYLVGVTIGPEHIEAQGYISETPHPITAALQYQGRTYYPVTPLEPGVWLLRHPDPAYRLSDPIELEVHDEARG